MKYRVPIYIITFVISVSILLFVAVPHHITEKQAITNVYNYINEHKNNDVTIEFKRIYKCYNRKAPEATKTIPGIGAKNYKFDLMESIFDYWNPDLKFWEVTFINNNGVEYSLQVDSYSGFVSGGDRIIWNLLKNIKLILYV